MKVIGKQPEPNTVNQGKTSPRFAFMQRFTIPSRNYDGAYLCRLRLIDTPWFGVYLHCILGPDEDPHLHNHPATFRAIILSGSYKDVWRAGLTTPALPPMTHDRFTMNKILHGEFHRIVETDGPVWTLVLRGRRKSSWGFLVKGEVIDYTEYLDPAKWGTWDV